MSYRIPPDKPPDDQTTSSGSNGDEVHIEKITKTVSQGDQIPSSLGKKKISNEEVQMSSSKDEATAKLIGIINGKSSKLASEKEKLKGKLADLIVTNKMKRKTLIELQKDAKRKRTLAVSLQNSTQLETYK